MPSCVATAGRVPLSAGATKGGRCNDLRRCIKISQTAALVGFGSLAVGANSTAVGQAAVAGFANSAAFGSGAVTARANQQVFGTAANTYTMPGITSAASAAAQTGPISVVTSDAAGNLATTNNIATQTGINATNARINDLQAGVAALAKFGVDAQQEARRGIAAAAAQPAMIMPTRPGRTTVAVKVAHYRGQMGPGVTVAHSMDTAIPVVIFGSYSNGGGRDHIISAGGGIEF